MSDDNDQGWNIVDGEARPSWVARLLGASKNGEPSIYVILFWIVMAISATKWLGLW